MTYTSDIFPSISTLIVKSAFGTGLKDECTSVSSRSSTRHGFHFGGSARDEDADSDAWPPMCTAGAS